MAFQPRIFAKVFCFPLQSQLIALDVSYQKSLNINDGEIEASFTFKPRKSVSSWTGDEVVAGDFAYKGYAKEENMFGVILYARVSDNPGILLSGDDAVYRLDFTKPFDHEDEVIAMGTVNVFRISFKKQT